MGGRIGFPFGTAYHGTKFTLEGISESMRYEIEPFGIKVVLIEPGVIRTNFIKNARVGQKAADPSSPYSWILHAVQKAFERYSGQEITPPEEVAKAILKAVTSENPDIRYVVGNDAIQLMEAKKRMSDLEFEGLIKQQFFGQ
jgi:NAD(P)-dependent dehydrogenase (short-subunit alcohol dehydrogenase family)